MLSHGSAAALWGLLERFPEHPTVVIRHGRRRSRPGLTVHRTSALGAEEIRAREGLPLTSPARTIMDLALGTSDDELEQATGAARLRRLLRPGELERLLASHPRRPGVVRVTWRQLRDAPLAVVASLAMALGFHAA